MSYLMDRSFYIKGERGHEGSRLQAEASSAGLGSVHPETVTTLVRLKNSQQSWVPQRKIAVGGALGSKQHVSNTCWTHLDPQRLLRTHIYVYPHNMKDRPIQLELEIHC